MSALCWQSNKNAEKSAALVQKTSEFHHVVISQLIQPLSKRVKKIMKKMTKILKKKKRWFQDEVFHRSLQPHPPQSGAKKKMEESSLHPDSRC